MRNEKTSARVASKAGAILAAKFPADEWVIIGWYRGGRTRELSMYGRDLNAICASALTQTADKPKWPALPVNAAPRRTKKAGKILFIDDDLKFSKRPIARLLKRGPGAKPLGKFRRRVDLRARPKKERK